MPLLTLLLVPFVFTLGGFIFSGLLAPMSEALDVSVATAGSLQSAFALACAFTGPVLARFTMVAERRRLLMITLALLAVLNAASAVAPYFQWLLALRIAVGAAGALALPLAVAIVASLAPEERRAKAIAAVYSGVAFALMIGVPLGSVIGGYLGWRSTFMATALMSFIVLLLVYRNVPKVPAMPRSQGSGGLGLAAVGYLGVTFLAFASMFALVGFIGPVITALTGAGPLGIALFQVVVGLSCLLGLRLGAAIAMSGFRGGLALLFAGMFVALVIVVHPLSIGAAFTYGALAMLISGIVGPASQFATAPIVQTRLAQSAGPAATLAFALNGSMVYFGQGAGISLGAAALSAKGLAAAPLAGALVAALGAAVSLALVFFGARRK